MEARPVVVLSDEDLDVLAQVPQIPIAVRIDLFPLQRFQETFTAGVVVRVCGPAHARDHLVVLKELHVLARGVLARRSVARTGLAQSLHLSKPFLLKFNYGQVYIPGIISDLVSLEVNQFLVSG
jgi:hypothetical protein